MDATAGAEPAPSRATGATEPAVDPPMGGRSTDTVAANDHQAMTVGEAAAPGATATVGDAAQLGEATQTDIVAAARRPPVGWAVVVAALLLVGVAGIAVLSRPDPTIPITIPNLAVLPPTHHVFADSTGVTLVFDAGHDGLVAVDLDSGLAHRYRYPSKLDDDRLTQVGDRLVFATSAEPVSVPLSLDGEPQPIGTEPTDQFVAAGGADRVWLLYGTPATGGRARPAGLAAGDADDLADTSVGATVTWPAGTAIPAALPDRILLASPGRADPLAWMRAGAGDPEPVDAPGLCVPPVTGRGSAVVVGIGAPTCNGVQRLGSTGLVTPAVTIADLREIAVDSVAPTGDRAIVSGLDAQGNDGGVWLVDFGPGTARRLPAMPPPATSLVAWSPDGQQLYALSTRDEVTSLVRFDVASGVQEEHPTDLDPVRRATTALGRPTTVAMVAIPSSAGPSLDPTVAPCVAPIAESGSAPLPPTVGDTTCLLPAAAPH